MPCVGPLSAEQFGRQVRDGNLWGFMLVSAERLSDEVQVLMQR